jgi:hypothetical protein
VALAKNWPIELAPWVGTLSSVVTKGSLHAGMPSVLCLAWLAQCGRDEAEPVHELDSRALDAIRSCRISVEDLDGLLPTRGLINLLAELYVARRPPITTSAAKAAEDTDLALLILLVRCLHERACNDDSQREHANAGDERDGEALQRQGQGEMKVTRVLLALSQRINQQLLCKHANEWSAAEGELQRYLPADSLLLHIASTWAQG